MKINCNQQGRKGSFSGLLVLTLLLVLSASLFASIFRAATLHPRSSRSGGPTAWQAQLLRTPTLGPAYAQGSGLAGHYSIIPLLQPTLGSASAGHYSEAPASIITVTSTNDSGPGTLRQAIADAQDGDTIQFDPALNGQTINLTTDQLVVSKNITITWPDPNRLTVRRNA